MSEENEFWLSERSFSQSAFGAAALRGDADEMRRIAAANPMGSTDYPQAIEMLIWAHLDSSPVRQQEVLRALTVLEQLGFRVTNDCFRGLRTEFGWPTIIGALVWKRVDNADIARTLIRLGASPSKMYADTPVKYETWQAAYELGLDALAGELRKVSGGGQPTPGNALVRACLQSDPVAASAALKEIPDTERARAVRIEGASGAQAMHTAWSRVAYSRMSPDAAVSADEMRDKALAVLLLVIGEAGPLGAREGAVMAVVAAMAGDISLWQDVRAQMGDEASAVLREETLLEVFHKELQTLPNFGNTPDPVATRLVLFDAFGRDSEAMRLSGKIMEYYGARRERTDDHPDLEQFESALRRAAEGEGEYYDVTVGIASTRRPNLNAAASKRFGDAAPDGRLSFGTATVRVPLLGRNYGALPEPGFFAHITGHMPPGLIEIRSCTAKEGADVPAPCGAKEALIYVHGYNVSFERAVRRAAQIAVDIKTTADPWAFCWPSQGRLLAYIADEDQVPDAGHKLAELVDKLSAQYQRIHVYAHSTGARIIQVAAQHLATSGQRLTEIVLFAGDLDAGVFRQNVRTIGGVCERLTNYSSEGDKILRLSRAIRFATGVRVGDSVPDLRGVKPPVANVELVDATLVDSRGCFSFLSLGHFYYGGDRTVLLDLHEVLEGVPAMDRPTTQYESAPPHWRLR